MSTEASKSITLKGTHGLHARPATAFVETAKKFKSDVVILHNGQEVDGKSIISILTLGVGQGAAITIKASGNDAQKAVDDLITLIKTSESFD